MQMSLPIAITVTQVIQENHRTKTFVTDISIDAIPGQFVMIWIPAVAEKPFSITDNDPFTFTVQTVGNFTSYINKHIKAGDKLWYRGPFGRGVYQQVSGKKVLVSGGCGCVPLYYLGKTISDTENTTVIVGGQNKDELLYVERFRQLGFDVIVTTDDGSQGEKGFTTDVLQRLLEEQQTATVYSCGPSPMLKQVDKLCTEYKVPCQLSLESLMKCGFGICGACSCQGQLVCDDGPVFDTYYEH